MEECWMDICSFPIQVENMISPTHYLNQIPAKKGSAVSRELSVNPGIDVDSTDGSNPPKQNYCSLLDNYEQGMHRNPQNKRTTAIHHLEYETSMLQFK